MLKLMIHRWGFLIYKPTYQASDIYLQMFPLFSLFLFFLLMLRDSRQTVEKVH